MQYQAAAIQYDCRFMEKEHNLECLSQLVRQAANQGAKLIVLPEMCATGYYFNSMEQADRMAEEVPGGKTTAWFTALAKELDCYIVAGLPEVEDGKLYNTAILTGPTGYIGRHRKMHHFVPDSTWAKTGDHPIEVFDTPLGKIAIQICMDVSYPETVRIAKLLGAQVLCVPMNWCEEVMPSSIWITRSRENGLYLVASNRAGMEKGHAFTGASAIVAPDGHVISCLPDGDGIVMGTIDLAFQPDMEELPGRRPALYRSLQLQRYPWCQNNYYQNFATPPIPSGDRRKVAVVQKKPGTRDENVNEIKRAIAHAAQQGISLMVLPELFLDGVPASEAEARKNALKPESELICALSNLARQQNVDVIVGLILEEGNVLYNAAACLLASGEICFYKKTHLTQSDRMWAQAGEDAGFFVDLPYARVGVLLGAESMVTELPRILANYGCDIVAIPSAAKHCCAPYPGSANEESHWHIARVRANENNTYMAFAGQEGVSGIFGPDMFLSPRNEALLFHEGTVELIVDTNLILQDPQSQEYVINVAREKPMMATRHIVWYDQLIQTKSGD